ncbi:MAG: SIS domain-containing protein [Alphaproteobacteria bacterium]|nr:SIS domain-containing protein [Alphaproteobacteria bacterium]
MTDDELNRFLDAEFAEIAQVAAATRAAVAEPFRRLVRASVAALNAGGKLMFFGNGGSASDSMHLATEFSVRFIKDRRALAAMALTADSAAITAIGNDFGYEQLFARQIEALGRKGDVAIALSTSGVSPNVLAGLRQAKAMGIVPAGFGGKGGGKMKALADPFLLVPSSTTARIQEMHIALGQMLCGAIERELGLP